MILSIVKILVVLGLLSLFLYATSLISHRTQINPELLRKIVHSGLGLVCATFPWVFSSTWELVILCAGVLAILLCARYRPTLKQKLGMGLYGVKRNSIGDLLFGITVVLLFHYSQNNHVLYILPILILTLSDSAAALIGMHYGKHTFAITDGQKSWEGCIAFFIVTFFLTWLTLNTLTNLTLLHILLIAAILGLVGSLVEAVAWHGWDNLFVPLGLFLLLQSLETQPLSQLLLALAILVCFSLSARKLNRYSELNTHALLGALLAAYFFWETGGFHWLLPPLIVFAIHIMLSSLQKDPCHGYYRIDSVISIVAAGIFWIFFSRQNTFVYAYYLFVLSMAIHIQIMILLRIKTQRGHPSEYPFVILVALFSGWIFLPALLLHYPINRLNLLIFSSGFLIMAIGGMVLQINTAKTASLNRWFIQGIYATAGSIIGLIPIYFHALWSQP